MLSLTNLVFIKAINPFPNTLFWDCAKFKENADNNWNVVIIPFPHNDAFWRPWETSLLKTLWEKEKLLVTSNFSFTHSVFYQFRELSAIYIV